MSVKPIPDGYESIIPYLVCQNADKVIDFMKKAFDAKEINCSTWPDGKVMHADFVIGKSHVMLSEASGEWKSMPTMLYFYVNNVDEAYKRAIKAGGVSLREPTNEFYGDRSCGVKDAGGNQWWIGTHVEDVPPEEMKKREEAFTKQKAKS